MLLMKLLFLEYVGEKDIPDDLQVIISTLLMDLNNLKK